MNNSPNSRRAMTLIELVVMLVVLATLTLTILPAMTKMRDAAENEQSKAKSDADRAGTRCVRERQ